MRNAGLDEAQAGIKIAGRNIKNLRFTDCVVLKNVTKKKDWGQQIEEEKGHPNTGCDMGFLF